MNTYAAYHVMRGGVDPYGLAEAEWKRTLKVKWFRSRVNIDRKIARMGWFYHTKEDWSMVHHVAFKVSKNSITGAHTAKDDLTSSMNGRSYNFYVNYAANKTSKETTTRKYDHNDERDTTVTHMNTTIVDLDCDNGTKGIRVKIEGKVTSKVQTGKKKLSGDFDLTKISTPIGSAGADEDGYTASAGIKGYGASFKWTPPKGYNAQKTYHEAKYMEAWDICCDSDNSKGYSVTKVNNPALTDYDITTPVNDDTGGVSFDILR